MARATTMGAASGVIGMRFLAQPPAAKTANPRISQVGVRLSMLVVCSAPGGNRPDRDGPSHNARSRVTGAPAAQR